MSGVPKPRYNDEPYIVLDGIDESQTWMPDLNLHRSIIDRDGLLMFDLAPFRMVQVVYRDVDDGRKIPSNWYYIDSGYDGHCVRTFTAAQSVMEATMKRHLLPPLKPHLDVVVMDVCASNKFRVSIGAIPRESADRLAQLCVDEWEWACGIADLEWNEQVDTIEFHVDVSNDTWYEIGRQIRQLTYWVNMEEGIRI